MYSDSDEEDVQKNYKNAVEVYATEIMGMKVAGVKANATAAEVRTGTSVTRQMVYARAEAHGPRYEAKAVLLENVMEAKVKAVAGEAKASASVDLDKFKASAVASATVGKVEAGILHTPLKAHAQGPSAIAETGVSLDYTGACVGAQVGEARAGPFAIRAGLKFGFGIRNGLPEIDLGPITL